jgi:nucleotide sugar dehydrogenase
VDPYYLVYKARQTGMETRLITAGRAVNNAMPKHVIHLAEKGLSKNGKKLVGSRILILGYSYKPDVGDPRETPGEDIVFGLKGRGANVVVLDPMVKQEYFKEHGLDSCASLDKCGGKFDAVVLVTYHSAFKSLDWKALAKANPNAVVVDGPRKLDAEALSKLGFRYLGVGAGEWNER